MNATEPNGNGVTSMEENISLLAIEAANELDEIVRGRGSSLRSVKQLADLLRKSFRIGADQNRGNFVDSSTVAVVSQAFDGFDEGAKITTVSELASKAAEVVTGLETSPNNSGTWDVAKVRDFCVALSRAASAYQQSIYDLRPAHPFRD